MITVHVTVFGGMAPTPIKLIIDNLANTHDFSYSSATSFSQNFDLPKGEYLLTVSGLNPKAAGAHTEIKVSGSFMSSPVPASQVDTTQPFYSEAFYFEI
jgi:hypothetical protein